MFGSDASLLIPSSIKGKIAPPPPPLEAGKIHGRSSSRVTRPDKRL